MIKLLQVYLEAIENEYYKKRSEVSSPHGLQKSASITNRPRLMSILNIFTKKPANVS